MRRLIRVRHPVLLAAGPASAHVSTPPSIVVPAGPAGLPGDGQARQTLAPITLTSSDMDVDLTNGGRLRRPATAKVANLSSYILQLTFNGHNDYLRPSETNVFPTEGATIMHVHPVTGVGSGTLLVAVASDNVEFPGTWPIMNNRPTGVPVNQTISVPSGTSESFTIQAGSVYLTLLLSPTNGKCAYTLTGDQTGQQYLNETIPPVAGGLLRYVKLNPGDSSATFANSGPGNLGGNVGFSSDSAGPEVYPTPAPVWLAPNLAPIRIAQAFPTTQATAVELRQGVAGQSLRILQLALAWDTALTGGKSLHLVDAAHGSPSAGTIIGDVSQQLQNPPSLGPGGPLTIGNSLYAWADDGTVTGRGWLSLSVGTP